MKVKRFSTARDKELKYTDPAILMRTVSYTPD